MTVRAEQFALLDFSFECLNRHSTVSLSSYLELFLYVVWVVENEARGTVLTTLDTLAPPFLFTDDFRSCAWAWLLGGFVIPSLLRTEVSPGFIVGQVNVVRLGLDASSHVRASSYKFITLVSRSVLLWWWVLCVVLAAGWPHVYIHPFVGRGPYDVSELPSMRSEPRLLR